jgi:hypothetical protein
MNMRLHARTLTMFVALACAAPITFWPDRAHAQRRAAGAQTLFGSETRVRRPVKLAADVLRQIMETERECLSNTEKSDAQAARDVAGSAIDINGDVAADILAQGLGGCFTGAHSTTFFVFSKSEVRLAPGYDLVLTTPADYLEIRRASTNGYRDIETGYHTALEMYSTLWKFDGQKYQPRECAIETFKTRKRARVPCDR